MNTPKEKGLCISLTHSTIMYPFKTIYLQWEPQTSACLVAIACFQAYLSGSAEESRPCRSCPRRAFGRAARWPVPGASLCRGICLPGLTVATRRVFKFDPPVTRSLQGRLVREPVSRIVLVQLGFQRFLPRDGSQGWPRTVVYRPPRTGTHDRHLPANDQRSRQPEQSPGSLWPAAKPALASRYQGPQGAFPRVPWQAPRTRCCAPAPAATYLHSKACLETAVNNTEHLPAGQRSAVHLRPVSPYNV